MHKVQKRLRSDNVRGTEICPKIIKMNHKDDKDYEDAFILLISFLKIFIFRHIVSTMCHQCRLGDSRKEEDEPSLWCSTEASCVTLFGVERKRVAALSGWLLSQWKGNPVSSIPTGCYQKAETHQDGSLCSRAKFGGQRTASPQSPRSKAQAGLFFFILELPEPRISVQLSTEAMWQMINFSGRLEAQGSGARCFGEQGMKGPRSREVHVTGLKPVLLVHGPQAQQSTKEMQQSTRRRARAWNVKRLNKSCVISFTKRHILRNKNENYTIHWLHPPVFAAQLCQRTRLFERRKESSGWRRSGRMQNLLCLTSYASLMTFSQLFQPHPHRSAIKEQSEGGGGETQTPQDSLSREAQLSQIIRLWKLCLLSQCWLEPASLPPCLDMSSLMKK